MKTRIALALIMRAHRALLFNAARATVQAVLRHPFTAIAMMTVIYTTAAFTAIASARAERDHARAVLYRSRMQVDSLNTVLSLYQNPERP